MPHRSRRNATFRLAGETSDQRPPRGDGQELIFKLPRASSSEKAISFRWTKELPPGRCKNSISLPASNLAPRINDPKGPFTLLNKKAPERNGDECRHVRTIGKNDFFRRRERLTPQNFRGKYSYNQRTR